MAAVSTKGSYGLAAMVELAAATGEGTLQIKEIAQRAQVPQNYLEQLLPALKKAGLLVSVRGAHGGYKLAKAPEEITAYQVLDALENSLCDASAGTTTPAMELFWKETGEKVRQALAIPLSEILAYKEQVSGQNMYYI